MLSLIRFYMKEYLGILSFKPCMDDSDNSLSEASDAYSNIKFCIDVWSIASCL